VPGSSACWPRPSAAGRLGAPDGDTTTAAGSPRSSARASSTLLHHQAAQRRNRAGLAISRSIVEQHQGAIEVGTRVGRGTSFHFLFPVRREAAV
jgi:hypothetical protein